MQDEIHPEGIDILTRNQSTENWVRNQVSIIFFGLISFIDQQSVAWSDGRHSSKMMMMMMMSRGSSWKCFLIVSMSISCLRIDNFNFWKETNKFFAWDLSLTSISSFPLLYSCCIAASKLQKNILLARSTQQKQQRLSKEKRNLCTPLEIMNENRSEEQRV